VHETAPELWQKMHDMNVLTLRNMVAAVVPGMIERGHGAIVNVGAFGARRTAAEMRFASQAAGWVHLRPFPAYTSRPEHAAASAGAFFAARLLEKYEAAVERAFDDGEPPPAPIMRWIEPLTLWGRLWTTYVPQHHVADDLLPDGGD